MQYDQPYQPLPPVGEGLFHRGHRHLRIKAYP
jgi:hypothetical protein